MLKKRLLSGMMIAVPSTMSLPNINRQEIQTQRTSRHNQVRTQQKLSGFTYNTNTEKATQSRANTLGIVNTTTHKRTAKDQYYSYDNITKRFQQQGITFPKQKNQTIAFSENLARNIYTCKKTDCTADLLKVLKKGFDFFMSEKGKSYQPHYKAIITKQFKDISLGVGYNTGSQKVFIVSHYTVDL